MITNFVNEFAPPTLQPFWHECMMHGKYDDSYLNIVHNFVLQTFVVCATTQLGLSSVDTSLISQVGKIVIVKKKKNLYIS